jgi:hypothetical protein
MQKTLDTKLTQLSANRAHPAFILADAKDADMAFGIVSPGVRPDSGGGVARMRSMIDFQDQIKEIVKQALVDIMLMSASTSEHLTIQQRIFDYSRVTPAVRANDTTDVHIIRGSSYAAAPSRPFATTTIDQIQSGLYPAPSRTPGANLGLYSVTFNNLPEYDLATLEAYKAFRLEAESKKFTHFLEVFDPNVAPAVHKVPPELIGGFVNDHIARMLAGVPTASRPRFLKIAYHGPASMEELCNYDPTLIVGILGGAAGTTHDAFHLLAEAKKYGARVALFGRKIKLAEHQLSFVEHLRRVADDEITPQEAVKSYHGALGKLGIKPQRTLAKDLELTVRYSSYGAGPPARARCGAGKKR